MNRRNALFAAAAAAGLGVGATAGWWQLRSGPGAEPEADLWSQRFLEPGGRTLDLRSLYGEPLLLNFWATWCHPCIAEIPLLDAFAQAERAHWNVLALAIDHAEAVQRFIDGRSFTLRVALAAESGLDLSRSLGNGAGGLPFSVVFDRGGRAVSKRLGTVDAAWLQHWKEKSV